MPAGPGDEPSHPETMPASRRRRSKADDELTDIACGLAGVFPGDHGLSGSALPSNSISIDTLFHLFFGVGSVAAGGGALHAYGDLIKTWLSEHASVQNMLLLLSALCLLGTGLQVVSLVASSAHLSYRRCRAHKLISKRSFPRRLTIRSPGMRTVTSMRIVPPCASYVYRSPRHSGRLMM